MQRTGRPNLYLPDLGSSHQVSLVGIPQTKSSSRFAATRPFVRGFLLPVLFFVGAIVLLVFLAAGAEATHYRYGTLSWEPTENPNEVRFTGAQAWRATAFGTPAVGSVIPGESQILTGDSGSVNVFLKVVSYNSVNDWFFAEFVNATGQSDLRHTYAGPNNAGQPWVASWASCCRISPVSSGNYHVNNPDQSERLETHIDLATSNSSPKTNLPPINSCPLNALCTIPVPFVDDDDDALSFRLATLSEAGDPAYVPPGPPHATNGATIGATSGVITWDTSGATNDPSLHTLYSMQVMLEDGQTKTPLDFFIELIPVGVDIPEWTPESNCGGTVTVGTNGFIQFDVTAFSNDPGRTLTIDHLGLPPGAAFAPGSPSNPVSGTFTWTPAQTDAGSHIVIFTAVDDLGYSAPACPITIVVVPHPPPTFFNTPCGAPNTIYGVAGVLITFDVHANSTNLSRTVSLSLDSGPAGLLFSPGTPANPTSGTATWPSPTFGAHVATFLATDSGGITARCRVHIQIVEPDAESHTLGVWIGHTVPISAEYESEGADATSGGSDGGVSHTLLVPSAQLYAEAIEETAATTRTSPLSGASGYSETGYVSLLGGQVEIWGLTNQATLDWNGATKTHEIDETREIARLSINGMPVVIDDAAGPVSIPLPTGGTLELFERSLTLDDNGAVLRSNLVHLHSAPGYSGTEVILGSLVLQAATNLEDIAQERHVLIQDDAGCGCDAPGATSGAVPIGPGVHHGSVPGNDGADMYAVDLAHGEKLVFLVDGAERELIQGGSAHLFEPAVPPSPTPPDVTAPTRTSSGANDYRVTLYDPTGAEREFAEFALSQAPERIEMNADLNGTWHLNVARLSAAAGSADNYTMTLTVTPVPLLPQNDALVLGDAPGSCTVGGLMPNVDTGLWPGVLRDDDFDDFYHFDAEISELITLVVKPGETADGVNMALSLWDRDCVLLQYADGFGAQGSGTKGAPEPILELPSAYTGDYYVGIHRINGVGNHYLQVNVVDPMPSLPTNDGGTGGDAPDDWQSGSVQAGPAFQGTLPEGDTGDGYRIPFDAGRRVTLTFEGSAASQYDVRFYTPAGVEIAPLVTLLGDQTVVYAFTPTATGQYGIEIQALVGGGDYVVAWAQAPVAF